MLKAALQISATFVAILLATSCTPAVDEDPPPEGPASTLATYNPSGNDGGDEAAIEGLLTITDGCVSVNDSVALVLPDTADWDGKSIAWNGASYSLGANIQFGGAFFETSNTLPESCSQLETFWVSSAP